ncbi:8ae02627-6b4c-42d4-9f96-68d528427e71 [Thermothielavioides terrestris]|uniref:8ae02627-6b4c-42d4-9f96-68d528427e71 n=1 Tax=Thermothielavioides terrestris TaxID=2587410 RepID=A0A3S5CWG2_9PEZI|nr:8ae02627-6b4c-42d4-9f96-68d528427e71 [Thermothielavioides terrestris]
MPTNNAPATNWVLYRTKDPGVAAVEKDNEQRNKSITDADVRPVHDRPGHIGTPESMDAVVDQDNAPLGEAEVDDDLEDAAAEPPTSASRPGYVAAGGYNALKTFNGRVYSGMAIGGSHMWNYDQGQWKETKVEPDLWKVEFATKKHRARNAPKGSGAPVGTEYHWLLVAHQHVKKIDANTYETRLVGSKYKLAHKLASSNAWSVPTVKAQREREVELLEDAKLRVQGLPPVAAGEKVRTTKDEKGQLKLDALFAKAKKGGAETSGPSGSGETKRKREFSGSGDSE